MVDVAFYEAFEEEEREIKKFFPKHLRARFTSKTIQESGGRDLPAGLISIRTQSRIPLEWVKDIDGILTRSQGYDHLLEFRQDIPCGYLGSYCSRAVAEQAVLMMMALWRKLRQQTRQLAAFNRDGLTGKECRGRRALVVGVGNIGKEIVDIVQGLKMTVKGIDIAPTLKSIDYVGLSEGLAWADAVFCALPLTEQTRNMLNAAALKKCRPEAVFINIARGEIAPVTELKRLLDEGVLTGIGLDVYSEENVLADALRAGRTDRCASAETILELARDERVILTPHNAFNTCEALERKAALSAESVEAFLKSKTFPYPVPAA